MAYQSQKYQMGKDPFTAPPLPKSFYHPSPTKEVNEREVIQSPERKCDFTQRNGALEKFLREHSTFKTSALPDVKTLTSQTNRQESMRSEDYIGSSGHLDESWPDSERPSSLSISIAESQPTPSKEYSDVKDSKMNVPDIVSAFHKLKTAYAPEPVGQKTEKDDGLNTGTSDSVLQRYIDRFRNSAPQSREERLKEREKRNQDFWWLNSSPPHTADTTATEDNDRSKKSRQPAESSRAELTRDALLAMDEQTMKIQQRADKLLSRSELSLASSGPIVSTDGLGTSTSVSDYSAYEDQPPYRPSFARPQESYHRPAPKIPLKTQEKVYMEHISTSKSPRDDILSRWRLRRKMEEMHAEPAVKSFTKTQAKNSHQLSEMDARLQDFRKKLLSQRETVTADDIQYERQRMKMLLDEDDGKKRPHEEPHSGLLKDPILERLQKITGRDDSESKFSTGSEPGYSAQKKTPDYCSRMETDDSVDNFNLNNASVGMSKRVKDLMQADTSLNKNNTAFSDLSPVENAAQSNSRGNGPIVDNFDSLTVFDPKEKVFVLKESVAYTSASTNGVHDKPEQVNENTNIDNQPEVENIKESNFNSTPASDLTDSNSDAIDFKNGDNIIHKVNQKTEDINRIQSENGESEDVSVQDRQSHQDDDVQSLGDQSVGVKHQTSAKTKSDKVYHQFLEAEKPIADHGDLKKNEMHVLNRNKERTTDPESHSPLEAKDLQENVQHKNRSTVSKKKGKMDTENVSERNVREEHGRRKSRKKKSAPDRLGPGEERTSTESEALSDVTNESDKSSRRSQRRSIHHKNDVAEVEVLKEEEERHSKRPSSRSRHEIVPPDPVHGEQPRQAKSSQARGRYPVQAAIGQTVVDHLFDGSVLVSSVDSWASMFPQSPAPSRSLLDSHLNTPSPPRRESITFQSTPLQSTPVDKSSSNGQAVAEEEFSDGEFEEDPLLILLREQRKQYLDKLELIELRLREIDNDPSR